MAPMRRLTGVEPAVDGRRNDAKSMVDRSCPCAVAQTAAGQGVGFGELGSGSDIVNRSIGRKMAVFTLGLLAAPVMAADAAGQCAAESDDHLRLACYDRSFRQPVQVNAGTTPERDGRGPASSAMEKTWELGADDKRGTFVVRTYLPNFLLPLHYTSSVNRSSGSAATPVPAGNPGYRHIDAKLQISLRTKLVEGLLLPGADLWAAYTQRSLWQVWDASDSSPFRSTDYQPELIYVVPVPPALGSLPLGWDWRMLKLGFAHQSNGQREPLSRSWNRFTMGAGFERGEFSVLLHANQRTRFQEKDDNPELADYIGRGEVTMAWSPGASNLSLTWRTNFKSAGRGSLQLDWTHPVFAKQPTGLRWYAQIFDGYGETLLDYDHRQTSLGFGLTLFQF